MFQSISFFGKTITLYGPLNTIAYLAAGLLMILHLKEYKSFCTLSILAEKAVYKKQSDTFFHRWVFVFLEVAVLFLASVALVSPLNAPLSRVFLGDTSEGYFPFIFFLPIVLFGWGVFFGQHRSNSWTSSLL